MQEHLLGKHSLNASREQSIYSMKILLKKSGRVDYLEDAILECVATLLLDHLESKPRHNNEKQLSVWQTDLDTITNIITCNLETLQ